MACIFPRGKVYWIRYSINGQSMQHSLKTKDYRTACYLKAIKEKELLEGKRILPRVNQPCHSALHDYDVFYASRRSKIHHKKEIIKITKFLVDAHVERFEGITPQCFQEHINRLLERKVGIHTLSHTTANRHITAIKTWLNHCVRTGVIAVNPLRDFKKYKIDVQPPHFLSKSEVSAVLAMALGTNLHPVVATAIYTGMRYSELRRLRWGDIDFILDQITVRRAKSKRFRVIPMNVELVKILRPLASEGPCFDFTNERRVIASILDKTKTKSNGQTWHLFRHTFASHLVMAGVDLPTVSKLLGHSSILVTMIYAHLTQDHAQAAIGKLNF